VSRTLAFKSRLLLLEVFEVNVLEVLRWFVIYVMIDKPKTSNTIKINQIEQQPEEFQYYDSMAR
jgi:hypothetical protein